MKFTLQATQFSADHSLILSDQYEIDGTDIAFKLSKGDLVLYANWNGFASQMDLDCVGLNAELLKSLNWKTGDVIDVERVQSMDAEWITVIPKTLHDWSIIQLQAEFLEDQMLSQIKIISHGMEIPLMVKDGGIVRVIVDATFPKTDGALKLTRGAEIRIAPLQKVEAYKKELRALPRSLFDLSSWSTIFVSPKDCALKGKIVRLNIIPFLEKKLAIDMYAFVDVLESLPPGQIVFSSGFDYVQVDYQRVRIQGPISQTNQLCVAISVFLIFSKDSNIKESETILERLRELLAHHLLLQQELLLYNGMYIDLSQNCDCAVKLEFSQPFLVISQKDLGMLQWKIMEHDQTLESLSIPSPSLARFDNCSRFKFSMGLVTELQQALKSNLTFTRDHQILGLANSKAVLLTGLSGVGKTSLSLYMSHIFSRDKDCHSYSQTISCRKMVDQSISSIRQTLIEVFLNAAWKSPSLLVFDDLDVLCSVDEEHSESARSYHLSIIFCTLALEFMDRYQISLLATTLDPQALQNYIKHSHFFGSKFRLNSPDRSQRSAIIQSFIENEKGETKDINWETLELETNGYLPRDLETLVKRAIHEMAVRMLESPISYEKVLNQIDFEAALKDFSPRSAAKKDQKICINWDNIGGYIDAKKALRQTLEWPTRYSSLFASCPIRCQSGILLFGYPGCGKTMLASAVATECGLSFISVKGPELLNKYIGSSEAAVRNVFERASASKPCILFFDEFDSLAPRRGHDNTGVTDRVVNQLLTQIDGAEGLDGVFILAATSRPDLIDPALLRPGRLDKSIFIDFPSPTERTQILKCASKQINLSQEVCLEDISLELERFSGADIQSLVYNAHLSSIQESFSPNCVITRAHFSKAQRETLPSLSHKDFSNYSRIYKEFMKGDIEDHVGHLTSFA